MSENALGFVSSSVPGRGSDQPSGIVSLDPLHSSQRPSPYPMHSSSGKGEGGSSSDLTFQSNPPPAAYAPASDEKKGMNDANPHSSSMDPNLTGARRSEGTQPGYPPMRQEQPPYRLDLLPTDPNLESNAPALHGDATEQDNVARAFPFLSNSMAGQDNDGRATIFPPNFSSVGSTATQDAAGAGALGYKKATDGSEGADASSVLHSKSGRETSYDTLSPPEKKETPYSRSPSLRVTHKIAERKRRKEMKDLFDELKEFVPVDRGPKTSKGDILTKAVLQFQALHREREQLIEALEAAHHELNQLRQMTGNADHASTGLSHHVYPHASAAAAPYLSRPPALAPPSRLPGSFLHGAQDQHLSRARGENKGDAPSHAAGVSMAPSPARTGEAFLSDLRLDRLRQPEEAVHANFKQLDHSSGVLDQSLGATTRSFQPESYQTGLVSSDLAEHQDNSMNTDPSTAHAGRPVARDQPFSTAPRYVPRTDGDLIPDSTPGDATHM